MHARLALCDLTNKECLKIFLARERIGFKAMYQSTEDVERRKKKKQKSKDKKKDKKKKARVLVGWKLWEEDPHQQHVEAQKKPHTPHPADVQDTKKRKREKIPVPEELIISKMARHSDLPLLLSNVHLKHSFTYIFKTK